MEQQIKAVCNANPQMVAKVLVETWRNGDNSDAMMITSKQAVLEWIRQNYKNENKLVTSELTKVSFNDDFVEDLASMCTFWDAVEELYDRDIDPCGVHGAVNTALRSLVKNAEFRKNIRTVIDVAAQDYKKTLEAVEDADKTFTKKRRVRWH